MFATSSLALPQNEQQNPRAFILAIIDQASKFALLLAVRDDLVY